MLAHHGDSRSAGVFWHQSHHENGQSADASSALGGALNDEINRLQKSIEMFQRKEKQLAEKRKDKSQTANQSLKGSMLLSHR